MERRLMVATATATLLLLGFMQLMAHDDKIHKALSAKWPQRLLTVWT